MISVIVPIYNSELTLERCIDSILSQTYTDFELLLIDDGSQDGSLSICETYATKDTRIRIYHQINNGVSSARNLGLSLALGEWISFIDSDDWVDDDYLMSMIKKLSSSNADLIVSGFVVEGDQWSKEYSFENAFIKLDNNNSSYFHKLVRSRLLFGPCCKLFNSRIIRDNAISFPINVSYGEDRLFNYSYLRYCKSLVVSSKNTYHYSHNNPQSLSSRRVNNMFELQYAQWKSLWSLYEQFGMITTLVKSDLLSELFWYLNDNLLDVKQMPLIKSCKYSKRILSISEIDQIKINHVQIDCNPLIKWFIIRRMNLMITLLYRLI